MNQSDHSSEFRNFMENARSFSQKSIQKILELELGPITKEIDHICYRVETLESYQKTKTLMEKNGSALLSEANIGGRPIATYKLLEPIDTQLGFTIPLIEIPSPKMETLYPEGFEHLEIVSSVTLETILEKYSNQINFCQKNFCAQRNRDISFSVGDAKVKIHEKSLEEIIKLENEEAILS